ncbi:MAG TPA: DUF669 domain-containing protein [Acidimicrobiales bacterium]|nr:DUF669 domain-containing protein [Acidimicrobiales bacterium]
MIDDGEYQAFIVDAEEGVDDGGDELLHLSVTILNGVHKGEVVEMTAARLGRTSIDVMGMPGTLVVTDGRPRLTIDG